MDILWRIIRMAAHYPARLSLAYISALAAIGFSLALPRLFGTGIDLLVERVESVNDLGAIVSEIVKRDFQIVGWGFDAVLFVGVGILVVSLCRGFCDFARTYTTESLSQMVSFDLPQPPV